MSSRLVLVATPLGNLEDLAPRAAAMLASADVIVCEDTRRTGRLLELVGVERRGRFIVANEHTEAAAAVDVVRALAEGQLVAVVSDAGMPGVSDPAARLVRAAIDAGHDVDVIPGPSAVTAAVAVSGFDTRRWVFEGFIARKGRARDAALERIGLDARPSVVFESPHRLAALIDELRARVDGGRQIVIVRELTKMHEQIWRGSLDQAADHIGSDRIRGEVTVVVDGAPTSEVDDDVIVHALRAERDGGASTRDAVDATAQALDVSRRRVYELAKELARRANEESVNEE